MPRAPGRVRARECGLYAREQARERLGIWPRQLSEQGAEPLAEQGLGRRESAPSGRREGQGQAATVIVDEPALDQADIRESREQLRDRRARDARAPRELGSRDPVARYRPKGEVLGDGQRGVVLSEQPLDPARRERRHRGERLRGIRLASAR
jgi:hypothetical protein